MKKYIKLLFAGLLAFVLIAGAVTYVPQFVSVSTNAGGRELPIYCVETEKPQIALSFDAAWADCK